MWRTMMYLLKQCPKCNGDLVTDRDQYGDFVSCLQCGLCRDIQVETLRIANRDSHQLTVATMMSDDEYRLPALQTQSAITRVAVPA